MDARLRAICDLSVPSAREDLGRHEYDGAVQDLSPDGVRSGLAALAGASAEPYADPHDEAQAAAAEAALRVQYGDLALHRANPLCHVENLDLAGYDRTYAPAPERDAARRRHLASWPDAVDAAIEALDRVPAPVAKATLVAVRGLAVQADGGGAVEEAARAAQERLAAHINRAAEDGPASAALGADALARLLSTAEASPVDLDGLARVANAERDRLRGILDEACRRIAPDGDTATTVRSLLADHPDADGVLDEARALTEEVLAWTAERGLVPYNDGECLVGPAPESRRWAMAMMSWAGPYEPDTPSWYHITPPDKSWPAREQEEWLQVFSRSTLPAVTVHEVAPGHYSHSRALRRAPSDVRRVVLSSAFIEGWAHYVEEVALEEGFRDGDPRFAAGVALEALIRVTRLACAIGLHTGGMTVADAARRFEADAFVEGPAARFEAERGTYDATYGRYTWGKLAILDAREQARRAWGDGFSLARFHRALLELGAPPLGLIGTAVERG